MQNLLALLALALPIHGAVHEQMAAVPFGWSKSKTSVSDSTLVTLSVALQYQNIDKLEAKLAYVSEPNSPGYGKYMDLEEQKAYFGPSKETVAKVTAWLKSSGATHITYVGDSLNFITTVGEANKMLDTEFGAYTYGEGVTKLRTTSYSVPDHLGDAVDVISPTVYFGTPSAHNTRSSVPRTPLGPARNFKRQLQTSCLDNILYDNETFSLITPTCLKELYNVGNYTTDPSAGSSIAFGSFLNESASYSDLAAFEKLFDIPSQNFTVLALINGGVNNQNVTTELDGEANLDVQNIIGLAGGLPVGEYITGGSPPFVPDVLAFDSVLSDPPNENEPYLPYYQYLLSQPNSNLPYVFTNSYGDDENTVPERYAKRVCNMIGMMGLRGRTILESAGDEGVGAPCRSNVNNATQFTPIFPATCPYITAVGGTQFYNPEYAWNASSGGFSFYFPQAWYQKEAISTYLTKHISLATKDYYATNNYTNFDGRGFPDVSAHSLYPYYLTVEAGESDPNGGTSAASPVFAAILALVNDARLRAGKPVLGFFNPLLYTIAGNTSAINDIVDGGSLGCLGYDLQDVDAGDIPGAGIIPYASWNATPGWDPVTGWGTPNFQHLKDVALAYGGNH